MQQNICKNQEVGSYVTLPRLPTPGAKGRLRIQVFSHQDQCNFYNPTFTDNKMATNFHT